MNSINGFQNTGSICYFNALVQCLLSSKNFIEFVKNNKEKNVFTKLFFEFLEREHKDVMFTTKLLQEILKNYTNKDIFYGQQSSSEFMIKLIDLMGVEKLFEIEYCVETTCLSCKNVSKKKDVNIFHNIFFINTTNILENISYSKEDVDSYFCDTCTKDDKKIRTKAEIERFLTKIPNIICIIFINKYTGQINPLKYCDKFGITKINSNEKEKNDEDKEDIYNLFSTIEHIGSLNGGHYFARIKRNILDNSDNYFLANDISINKIDKIDISNISYIIFYENK
jgi:ubiquitin C-terminal hydrolase